MRKKRIIIVDDHKLFRDGLKFVLDQMDNIEVMAEAATGVEFLEIIEHKKPDLVLMDISMPELNGIETTLMALAIQPKLKILVVSMYCDEDYYYQMIQAGVMGFVLKESGKDELENAINRVLNGENSFSQKLLTNVIVNFNKPVRSSVNNSNSDNLTKRELEVLKHICKGHSNAQIAEKLYISIRTVEGHKSNLIRKTGVKNTISLVMYALKNELVETKN